ncbi:glycine receptor subunit alpha-4-like [Lingula anatina]|uniref:Glycine receptor subunit alpha-4-like n=1 Tax=Lingula anatina TaxID=7574 RepID=A0A1S3HBD2_LINAN|nr:glycine receptor subunit alpha-4-like [Lingula anatina]|eukprot:XP_013383325.1 glycine receptor subunit alpha-4-like [Lingula anatina]
MIKLDEHFYRKIWLPDIFIRNEKRANFHEVTIPNRLMRLYSNGAVWYVTKITATLDCYMDLTNYPLDVQKCPLSLESFGNTMDVLTFKWMDNAVEKDENLRLPEYTLTSFDFQDCSRVYAAGAFPCLNVDFFLDRNREYFVMQVYLPSVLIVIMSWVGFWISIDASPARVSIGLLTVLTITTQATASRASQPKVSYIKAIDVWLAMCLVFVFASLLEYSLVNTFSRRQVPKPVRNRAQGIFCNSNSEKKKMCDDLQPHVEAAPEKEEVPDPQGREKAKRVDTVSRILFPFSFILFCFVYGLYYVVFARSSFSV